MLSLITGNGLFAGTTPNVVRVSLEPRQRQRLERNRLQRIKAWNLRFMEEMEESVNQVVMEKILVLQGTSKFNYDNVSKFGR